MGERRALPSDGASTFRTTMADPARVLLSGATGFVGSALYPTLKARGYEIRCGTRQPEKARRTSPERTWVELDLHRPATIDPAVEGIDVVYYLVHGMAEGAGYQERELQAADALVQAAARAEVGRIVYLGGVAPQGTPSPHLESRLETGRHLRAGAVPCLELRAGMVIGPGSASWRICRDLAMRLPFMILPKWMQTRSQPVAIEDVVVALEAAARLPCERSKIYDVPGPETMTAEQILRRIARLRGRAPRAVNVPVLSPKLSSYWLKLVSGADFAVARELVEGLRDDLVATGPELWDELPDHRRLTFDEAASAALQADGEGSTSARVVEALATLLSRRGAGSS